ncbi:PAS domain S-box protein [Chloroflexota bacterium]
MSGLGLTRHAMERILFLIPVVWSGFLFGIKGTIIASLVALGCMLPRAILISEYPVDALFETGAITLVGGFVSGLSAFSLRLLGRERQYLYELENAHQELAISEQRYRKLFENAHDAIWLQDMDGCILAANEASARLTGYDLESLKGMNVSEFLPEAALEIARNVRQKLLRGDSIENTYDQQMTRKDGTEAFLRLSTSLVIDNGQPVAFQNIARDVTEEKKLQENLQFYLKEATEAQEEERKRISRELHDETIQELVVLSQQLDILASKSKTLSEEDRRNIEKLQQDTGNIMREVRRLSQDLRPAALDRLGLLPALEWLTSDVKEYSGIEIKITTVGEMRRLSEQEELVLFRITQEAIRNSWRHSKATSVKITVEFGTDKVRITVSDNGQGFTPPKSIGDLAKEGKLGLAGMKERARLIGGIMTVRSQPGKGTDITVEVLTK